MQSDVTIVIMTRNRADDLRATLKRLIDLPGPHPIIVVDNGSNDGTVPLLAAAGPDAAACRLSHAAGGLPWVLRGRRVVPPNLEEQLHRLEGDATDRVAVPDTPVVAR